MGADENGVLKSPNGRALLKGACAVRMSQPLSSEAFNGRVMNNPEPFLDADGAAEFLAITPRRVKELGRHGLLPAHPLGNGKRRVWRFRLSELADSMANKVVAPGSNPSYGSSHRQSSAPKQENQ